MYLVDKYGFKAGSLQYEFAYYEYLGYVYANCLNQLMS